MKTLSELKQESIEPPVVSGGLPVLGHAIEFMRDPHKVIRRGYEEHGLLFTLDLGLRKAHVLLGPENHQFFFKETDGVFSKRRGYQTLMKMFDTKLFTFAHITEGKEQMKVILPLLKNDDRFIDLMLREVDDFMEKTLGDEGEVEIVDAFGPLVMHVGARAFFGDDFRENLGTEYFHIYKQFSLGADVVLPSWLPLPKFKRCLEAKEKIEQMLFELIQYR
jgi:sterol 14-demethylase